jgi:hypothetical protein
MNAFKENTSIIFSLFALIISGTSLYFSSIMAADVSLSAGEYLAISHENNALVVCLPVVLHNTGAHAGLISSIGVILKDQNGKDAIFLKWQSFAKFIERSQGHFQWVDESNATAISVPPLSDLTRMAVFSGGASTANWNQKPTTYDLYLVAWTPESDNPSIKPSKSTWTINEGEVSQIKRNFKVYSTGGTRIVRSIPPVQESKILSESEFKNLVKQQILYSSQLHSG